MKTIRQMTVSDFIKLYSVKYDKHALSILNILFKNNINLYKDNLTTDEISQIDTYVKSVNIRITVNSLGE